MGGCSQDCCPLVPKCGGFVSSDSLMPAVPEEGLVGVDVSTFFVFF